MDPYWILWVPLVAVIGCFALSRGAVARSTLIGFAVCCVIGIPVMLDTAHGFGSREAVRLWLFLGSHGAWLAAGIGAMRTGYHKVGVITIGAFCLFGLLCPSLS
jgi:hypothetical protein